MKQLFRNANIEKNEVRCKRAEVQKNRGQNPRFFAVVFQYKQGQNLQKRFAAHSHRQMLSPMPTEGKWPLRAV